MLPVGELGHPLEPGLGQEPAEQAALALEDPVGGAVRLESFEDIGGDERPGTWRACSIRNRTASLAGGRDRVVDAVAVAEPDVVPDEAADHVRDVPELAVAPVDELGVHVPEVVVVLALLRGRLDEVTGDPVDVLQAQRGGGQGVGAQVLGLLRGVLARVRVAEPERGVLELAGHDLVELLLLVIVGPGPGELAVAPLDGELVIG